MLCENILVLRCRKRLRVSGGPSSNPATPTARLMQDQTVHQFRSTSSHPGTNITYTSPSRLPTSRRFTVCDLIGFVIAGNVEEMRRALTVWPSSNSASPTLRYRIEWPAYRVFSRAARSRTSPIRALMSVRLPAIVDLIPTTEEVFLRAWKNLG